MTAQHDDLVLFIRAVDLAYNVVAGRAGRNDVTPDVELQRDTRIVSQKPDDPAKVLISHHNRRNDFSYIECPIIERPDRSPIELRLIDPHQRPVIDKKLIDLFVDLHARQSPRSWRRWCPAASAARTARSAAARTCSVGRIVTLFIIIVREPF